MSVHPYWTIVLSVVGLALIWLAAVAVWDAIVAFMVSPWFPIFAVVGAVAIAGGHHPMAALLTAPPSFY